MLFPDCLLCHDDELEGRRIAYIYYLVDDWTEADGGALDLFSVDGNYCSQVEFFDNKKILPLRCMLIFL